MAAEQSTINNVNESHPSGEEEKVDVGTFSFNVSAEDLEKIKGKIGDILQAQVILRGDNSLGYGTVNFRGPGASAAEGEISGDARLTHGSKRGRGAARGRGARRNAARARRSADDQEGEDPTNQNGTSIVGQVVEGVKNLVMGEGTTAGTEGEKGTAAGRGGKAKRGRGAAKPPRAKKERGEPSKTLVFIRNLPFSYTEEQVGTLFSSNSLSYVSLTMPVWKFGPRKGKGRGYAFATVSNEEEQKKTIDTLNGKEIATGEMFTPRKPATTEENAGEGADAASAEPIERILKLVARQGYENEEKDTAEAHDEEGAAAGTNGPGPEDSGTA